MRTSAEICYNTASCRTAGRLVINLKGETQRTGKSPWCAFWARRSGFVPRVMSPFGHTSRLCRTCRGDVFICGDAPAGICGKEGNKSDEDSCNRRSSSAVSSSRPTTKSASTPAPSPTPKSSPPPTTARIRWQRKSKGLNNIQRGQL